MRLAKKHGVTTKSIRRWKQNETIFKLIDNQNKKITLHGAPINRTINIELEKTLYDWIDYNRSLGNPITIWSIGIEIIKRDPTKRDIKPKSLLSFIYRFLARNNHSIRKGTHIGQQLPTNSLDLVYSFLKVIIQNRKMYNIDPEFIINMDETALNYNMPPNTTINKIRAKTIVIKTQR